MATFWQGNWARSPQKAIRIATDQPIRPTTWKTKPSHSKKEDQDTEAQDKVQKKEQKTPTRSWNIHVKVTVTIHFLRICFGNELVFTQIHENAKIVYTVLWFRSIKGTLSIAIRLYKSCSLPRFQYLCVWKIFCNNTLQKPRDTSPFIEQ